MSTADPPRVADTLNVLVAELTTKYAVPSVNPVGRVSANTL